MMQTYKDMHIVGLSELNRNWFQMQEKDQLREKFKKLWRHKRIKTSWLKDRDWRYSKVQQGGVATMMRGQAATYVQDVGEDSTGWGRWNWMSLEASAVNTKTTVIQMYRPTKNLEDAGSTFMQQKSRMRTDECPLQRFDEDLLEQIQKLQMEGFQIILMGDFNMDLTASGHLISELRKMGIIDVMEEMIGYSRATNTRTPGSKPIDGIFASKSLEVVRCGYDAGDTLMSDHRFIWAQFSWDSMLGVHRSKVCSPKERRLQTKYEKVVMKFNAMLEEEIERHKLLTKADALDKETTQDTPLTKEQEARYEQIDHQFARIVAGCEKKCRKLYPNDIAFSPTVKVAIANIAICKELKRRMELGKKVSPRLIMEMKKRWRIEKYFSVPATLEEAKHNLNSAWKEFRVVKEQAPELREHFIDSLIDAAEEKGDEEQVKKLVNIRNRERSELSHERIKFARGKMRQDSSVRYIQKDTDNGRVPIRDKKETIRGIMESTAAKLHQCNEGKTPLRREPLESLLSRNDYDVWESFLRGEIDIPEGLDKGTQEWLSLFHGIESEIEDMDLTMTHKEVMQGWGKMREKTSSLPHPIHFGVMKAMKDSEMTAKLHTIMMNIPLRTGYQPEAWKSDVEAMLLKKPGDLRPEKLRRISLLHTYFNFNNKTIGRRAMKNAEKIGILADEQAGSRKRLSAEKHALNKRLLLDILRVTKKPGILCANDAKSCYDRILHFAIFVSMRRAGVPKTAISSMLGILRGMKHKIRTAYGDSAESYGGEEDDDQHGASQGNGAGPAIWALVSSPLLEILRKHGFGAKLLGPIKKEFFHLCGFAFVDDTDTVQVMEPGTTTEELLETAQEELNLWEELIKATGGALEGEKSDFTIVQWEWKEGKATYMPMMGRQYTMHVVNSEGEEEDLTQLAPDEARRTLGVWQASDGNEVKQVEKMKEKAVDWTNRVQGSVLDRPDLELAVKTTLYPSLTYGQMATCLTREQCEEVFAPVKKKIVPKMKVCRNTPKALIHGPLKYGGLEFKHLHTTQGIEHIKALLSEGYKETSPTGKLIRILAENHVLEVGLPGDLFQQEAEQAGKFMTDSWIRNTMEFLSEHKIQIQSTVGEVQLWTENDSFLARDFLLTYGGVPDRATCESFTRCRMLLQAVTRSDISERDGRHMRRGIWNAEDTTQGTSSMAYEWPYQQGLSSQDLSVWRRFLSRAYGIEEQQHRWRIPCGRWTKEALKHTRWRVAQEENRLYERDEEHERWIVWSQRPSRSRRKTYYKNGEMTDHCPEDSREAAVHCRGEEIVVTSVTSKGETDTSDEDESEYEQEQEMDTEDRELRKSLSSIDSSLQWAIEDLELPSDGGVSIANAIRTGNGRCISDGSLKELFGTSAFKFITGTDPTYIGCNRVPGEDRDQDSYRSELCGILGNVLVINAVCQAQNITGDHEVVLGCDNISALWKTFDEDEPRQTDASCDLLLAIRYQIAQSPLQWKGKWVQGHQDDKKVHTVLDEWAWENIFVDKRAGEYWNKMVQELIPEDQEYWERANNRSLLRPPSTKMPGEAWQLRINGHKVIGRADSLIYDHCHKDEIVQYWVSKGRIMEGTEDTIDWDSHGKAMKAFGPRKHWVTKHFSGWAGSGTNMHKWGYRTSAKCPRCEGAESTLHVLRCPSEEADEEFWEAVEPLAEWLVKKASASEGEALMDHALAARDARPARVHPDWPPEVQQASQIQSSTGSRAMIEGLPVKQWRYMIQMGNTKGDSIEKGFRWTSALIRKNWEVSWSMWVARNELVHKDGETRNTLVINDLNSQLKKLQKEGSKCKDLFRDDRRFFRTPYWKLIKKTEEQKIRYVETATRLLAETRRSSQQTLDRWCSGGHTEEYTTDEDDNEDDNNDDDNDTFMTEVNTDDMLAPMSASTKQMKIQDYFGLGPATNPMSIDGIGTATQPSAGGLQPPAGVGPPSAGGLQPSAGASSDSSILT